MTTARTAKPEELPANNRQSECEFSGIIYLTPLYRRREWKKWAKKKSGKITTNDPFYSEWIDLQDKWFVFWACAHTRAYTSDNQDEFSVRLRRSDARCFSYAKKAKNKSTVGHVFSDRNRYRKPAESIEPCKRRIDSVDGRTMTSQSVAIRILHQNKLATPWNQPLRFEFFADKLYLPMCIVLHI